MQKGVIKEEHKNTNKTLKLQNATIELKIEKAELAGIYFGFQENVANFMSKIN